MSGFAQCTTRSWWAYRLWSWTTHGSRVRRDVVRLTPVQLVPQDDSSLLPPQPLILDPTLRTPLTARILSEWREHGSRPATGAQIVRQPWILCSNDASQLAATALEEAGARIVRVQLDANGHIPPTSLPEILQSLKLRSVMIEGGSRVLSSFLHAGKRRDGSALVDSVVVTVAPMFIGEGVSVVPQVSANPVTADSRARMLASHN